MKVVIAGGTGSLGQRLADDFVEHGHEVLILTRARRGDLPHRQVEWDGRTVGGGHPSSLARCLPRIEVPGAS